ncbi:hypothetical protein [Haliangium sp.]|uniref:hypothetical protein n=1 Tax=Haliangium sp. TaxID=2663208 RepID=UPI003D0FD9C1
MDTKVGERITDLARRGQDLEELSEQRPVDAYEGPLSEVEIEEFRAVCAAMRTVLDEARVDRIGERLTPGWRMVSDETRLGHAESRLAPSRRMALEKLFTAASARDADRNTFVSGMERKAMLEQALMELQPVLALALRPDFGEGREQYRGLVSAIKDVRKDIATASAVQLVPPQRRRVEVSLDEDEDERPEDESPEGESPEGDSVKN